MITSDNIDAIAAAFGKAQHGMEAATKDTANPFFKSKYADLATCWHACRDALAKNGLSVIQGNKPAEGGVLIETRLLHTSGQWIQDDGLFVPATKHDAQGFGSALTYARRYALSAMLGIAPEDDDGNAASKTAPQRKPQAVKRDPVKAITAAKDMAELSSVWESLSKAEKEQATAAKDQRKAALQEAA